MKHIFTLLLSLIGIASIAQIPTYKWIAGSSEPRGKTNLVLTEPGPRQGSSSFTDSDGNFWVFGGNGYDFTGNQGFYNDLWKYDRASETWEWVDGNMAVDQALSSSNNSLSFDGVNDFVEILNPPIDYTGDLTIEAWFNPKADGAIITYAVEEEASATFEGWRFEIVNSGNEIWIVRGFSLLATFTTDNLYNNWHHIAVTSERSENIFEGNSFKVYLDGELMVDNSQVLTDNGDLDFHVTYIGADVEENIFFTGEIDEVRFWNYARSYGEILSNKDIELSGNEEGLAAYYKFNQGVANSAGNYETELIDETGDQNGFLDNSFYRDGVFIGQMAEVRVWDYAMDFNDVAAIANSQVSGLEAGLVGAYDFSDGVAEADNTLISSITDLTANALDGTIQNFDLQGSTSNFVDANLGIVATPYDNLYGAERAVMGDFDGDTYEDVATITSNHSVSVFINDQAGGVGAYTEFALGTYARSLVTGHFNNDTFLDIAAVGWDNGTDDVIRIFFGDGTGDFPTTLDFDPGDNTHPESISAADLNDDNIDDFVVGTYVNNLINIYLSDGLGGFSAATIDAEWLYSRSIALADINNDTYLDIVTGIVIDGNTPLIGSYINDGLGAFTYLEQNGFPVIQGVVPVDVNQDGETDFLYQNGDFMGLLIGDGTGALQNTPNQRLDVALDHIFPIGFNGDNLQFYGSHAWQTNFYLVEVTPDGEFTILREFNTSSVPGDVMVVDFDKNGFEDLVFSESANRLNIMLRENDDFNRNAFVNALDFDGVNDYIDFADLRPFDNSFTWEGWIKTEDNGPLFSFSSNNPFSEFNSGHFSLAIKEGALTLMIFGIGEIVANDEKALTDGNWHHIALSVTINGGGTETVAIYVDGSEGVIETGYDFDTSIDNANINNSAKLGFASGDFKGQIGTTGQAPESNWMSGVDFPGPVDGRAYNAYWTDAAGEFYIFGGQGENGIFNSVKMYDKVAEEWITVNGVDNPGDVGSYGTKGISDPSNIPPFRWAMSATVDVDGNVWVFGGAANDNADEWYNDLWKYDPILNEWVWMSGSSTVNAPAVYGTGTSDPSNVPGPRSNHKIWSDANGDIWIFGGYGLDSEGSEGYLNDLWKFDVVTNEWTWMDGDNLIDQGGVFGALDEYNDTNYPGSRAASLTWSDPDGTIWLFGGQGIDKFGLQSGYLNDLWSLDPVSGQWAWHSGSDFAGSTGSYNEPGLSSTDYVPGARWHGINWIDENNELWLFGGSKFNQLSTGIYNDFWKYNPQTKEWTWLNGFNSTAKLDQLGEYGDLNAGSNPFPGSRHGALTWTDQEGIFWMLGGAEIGSSTYGFYNDLWKYEPQTNKWEYITGNTELSINEGEYGSIGIGSSNNVPKSRWHGVSWLGQDGKLWFFGGIHHNETIGDVAWLNDLWFFDPESNVYTWAGGNTTIDQPGVYGTKGEASTGHLPGARSSSAYWTDAEGNFWLFGGYESFEYNNDLWKLNPNTLEWTWVSGNNFQNAPGSYGEQGVSASSNSIGARRYMDGRIDQDGNVWVFGGNGFDSQGQFGWLNDLWKYNTTDNTWTWMAGSRFRNTPGVFGVQGESDPANLPPPRYGYGSWIDDSGNFWIFGGYGLLGEGESQTVGQLNDLWKFDVRTNEWTWIDGDTEFVTDGVFVDQGNFNTNNTFAGRARPQTFETYNKSLWLFGGRKNGSTSLNDFWEIKFIPDLPYVETPSVVTQTGFQFAFDEPWASQYQIQVALTDDFSDTFYDESTAQNSVGIPDLEPGTYYYYHVNAINEIGNSGFTTTENILTLPATPEFDVPAVAITNVSSSEVYIDWLVGTGIIDGYTIDISEDPNFDDNTLIHEDFTDKDLGYVQRAIAQNLKAGTRYYVRLRSYNSSGNSSYSQTLSFLTLPPTVIYPDPEVTEITQSSALISWEPASGILDNYRITVSTLDDGFTDTNAFLTDYNQLNIPKDRNSIRIEGLSPGTFYFAIVSAVNATGESEQPLNITILTTPESPVFDLETSILSVTQNEVTINWQAPVGFFEGYLLEVSTDFSFASPNLMLVGYGRGGVPADLGQSVLTETISGLLPGQTYYARIRAYNASGQSPNSNIIELRTVPSAPTFNTPNNISQTGASLSWAPTVGAETYLLDINTSSDFDEATSLFTNFPLAVPFQVLTDLTPGTRYYARVQASNASGNSGDQTPADYSTTDFITIPATPVLNDPDQITQSSIRVSWPAIEGVAGYEVDVSDNFFQTFLIGYAGVTVTDPEITITGLNSGSEYQIRVKAVNSSGKSSNASNFDLLTLPATPIARDATNSSANVFTANWDPVTGATFYVLEVSLDNFVTFHYNETLGSSNPVQMTNLVPGATYQYRVQAGNDAGASPYSNEISVIAQNTSQSLTISNVSFDADFGESETSTTVTVTTTNGLGNPEVLIRYKGLLSSTWSDLQSMNGSGSSFTFEFTDDMLDDVGVQFEIYANDNVTFVESLGHKIKRSFNEAQSSELPSLVFSQWQMISIPYVLENKQVTSVFNELTSLEYKKKWRLMHYNNGTEEYVDAITGFSNIEIGLGYWLNVLDEVTISVGAGTVNDEIPFKMSLSQGWNQIGNPFNTSVNWNAVLSDNGTNAVENLFIYQSNLKAFVSSSTITEFQGAFVWSDEEIVLDVTPSSLSGRVEDVNDRIARVDGDNWELPLLLGTNQGSFRIAGVGMHAQASDLKDTHDQLAPPRFESYIEMVTTKPEAVYPFFSTDIVKDKDEHIWTYNLSSNHLKGSITLEWDQLELNGYFGLWLVDEKSGKIIDMRGTNSYTFYFNESTNFSVHYSENPDYVVLPQSFALGDPYPNPASNETVIPLLLPDQKANYDIELSIYNLNGQKVKSIAEGEYHAGFHLFKWYPGEEDQITSGIYFYRLTFKNNDLNPITKKLIIKK